MRARHAHRQASGAPCFEIESKVGGAGWLRMPFAFNFFFFFYITNRQRKKEKILLLIRLRNVCCCCCVCAENGSAGGQFRARTTHLIPGEILDGTQGRVRELHIDKLLVVVELVLLGQTVNGVGSEAGSHLHVITTGVHLTGLSSSFLCSLAGRM